MSRVHQLIPDDLLTTAPTGTGDTVGDKVAMAHGLDAARHPDAGRTVGLDAVSRGDEVARHLLETVLRGEEAYVARMSRDLELARRRGSLLRHAEMRGVPVRHPVD